MILTDAGPLIALLDEGELSHAACCACLAQLTRPMLTTWPAFTEAMYLLGESGGWAAQDALWKLFDRGDVVVIELDEPQLQRSRWLMRKYRDLPMDLADSTLVAVAESRRLYDVFTLDRRDFSIDRVRGAPFRIWPPVT